MEKWTVVAIATIIYGFICYQWGKSAGTVEIIGKEIEVVEKEKEVIKYETKYQIKEVCNILAKPNLNDNDIIGLYEREGL